MELVQRQTQQLTQQTLQSLALLQMSTVELEAYVQELAQENPIIDLEPPRSEQEAPRDQELFRRVKWLEDSDRQNRYYQRLDAEELDPLAQVGTDGGLEESLSNFLFRQIQQLDLDESAKQLLRYLSACLDEDGYFRIPLDELSRTSGISQRRLARTLELLRSLEPAGVGASSLSQCLELQLLRIHEEGPALAIVRDCLEELAKKHYHAISARLSISQEEVRSAERLIRELNPRPGSIFALPSEISYIQPDILIEEIDGHFTARLRNSDRPYFQINSYYRSLLTQSDDAQVREYLTLKLRQAENVLWAIGQQETTLLRCAQAIAGRQQDFFRSGPSALRPLRLSDIEYAEARNKHVVFHLRDGRDIEALESFRSVEDRLAQNATFFKCHRSYQVNLRNIDHFDRTDIVMRSGACIPLSRSSKQGFQDAYFAVRFEGGQR